MDPCTTKELCLAPEPSQNPVYQDALEGDNKRHRTKNDERRAMLWYMMLHWTGKLLSRRAPLSLSRPGNMIVKDDDPT